MNMKCYEAPDIKEVSCALEGVLCSSPVIEEGTFGNAGDLIVDKEE